MKKAVSILIVVMLAVGSVFPQTTDTEVPPDFKSDGCTLFPDGNYRDCCVEHDKDYYKGGSSKERSKSDNRLYRCVKSKGAWYNKIVAPIMWVGVRIGGVGFLPTPFRWGFGKKKKKKKKQACQKREPTKKDKPADGGKDREKESPEPEKVPQPKASPSTPQPSPTPAATPEPPKADGDSKDDTSQVEDSNDESLDLIPTTDEQPL